MFIVRKANDDPTPPLNPDEEQIAKIIRQGITDAEKGALTPPVKDAIASRNYEAIVDAFPWDTVNSSLDLTKGPLADATKSKIGTGFPKVGFKGRFDYTDPRSIEWATQQSARLVTAVTDEMRSQIRDVIGQAFTQNKTVADTAKQLRTFIGLNARQQNSLEKFIEANAGKPNLDKLVADYKARAIKYRAQMIARTEIITAEANGRMLGWQQAIDSGWSSPNSVKRWSAALSERTCSICSSMNGKSVKWDKPFPNGIYDAPAHVMCRCSTVLLEPDSELAQDFMAADTVSIIPPPREDMPDKLSTAIAGLRSASDAVTAAHARSGSVSSFQYDSTAVENLNIDVQAIEFNGVPSTELTFKLTSDAVKAFEKEAKSVAGKKNWNIVKDIAAIDLKTADGKMVFATIDPDGMQNYAMLHVRKVGDIVWDSMATGHATYTRYLPDGTAIRIISSAKKGYAYHGTTRVVFAGKPTPTQIDNVLNKLFPSARPSTQADVDLLKANRILSIFQPANAELRAAEFAVKKKYIEDVVGKYWGFKWDEVETTLTGEGRINFLLPKSVAQKIMKDTGIKQIDHGLSYSVTGTRDEQTIENIIKLFTDPTQNVLLPTTHRWTRGINYGGQSSEKDILTGGADYVFMRPRNYSTEGVGGLYRYHYDPEEMFRRTDWFAYAADSYGIRNPQAKGFFKGSTSFSKPNWFGELMSSAPGAEIMFQGGVDRSMITRFPISSRIQMNLFTELLKRGITEINGKSLDEFFPVL